MIFQSYLTNQSAGNIVSVNKTLNVNGTETQVCVYLTDSSDYNLVMGNSSYGAKTGQAVYNGSSGTHNLIVNNLNAP
jgi:hypothetical protein